MILSMALAAAAFLIDDNRGDELCQSLFHVADDAEKLMEIDQS